MNSNIVFERFPVLRQCVQKLHQYGARIYLVGGAVRDMILKLPIKDIDIEVHDITIETLRDVLSEFGSVYEVGVSFGVLQLKGLPVDWALPRIDSRGRKPKVQIDPYMDIAQALRRRDLTMNAMAYDLIEQKLIDPFGGLQDIKDKILRTPDPQLFVEDPLRLFRVMQFIGRFNMYPDQTLTNICKTMDISGVSRERIEAEFAKLFLKSTAPSQGIRWLHAIGRLQKIMPELAQTVGIEQNPHWHPEGDVFEHTMQTVDVVATFPSEDHEKLILAWAALCHDLGKAVTTAIHDGKITSYNHEVEGVSLTKSFMHRFTENRSLIDPVVKLVRYHMSPGSFVKSHAKGSAYKRLALKLAPEVTCELLAKLAYADRKGRNPKKMVPLSEPDEMVEEFIAHAKKYGVLKHPEKPVITGKDLLDVVQPGPKLGQLVKHAYKIQIDEGIKDKVELKKRILSGL